MKTLRDVYAAYTLFTQKAASLQPTYNLSNDEKYPPVKRNHTELKALHQNLAGSLKKIQAMVNAQFQIEAKVATLKRMYPNKRLSGIRQMIIITFYDLPLDPPLEEELNKFLQLCDQMK